VSVVLAGGPFEGPVELGPSEPASTAWTLELVHVNCACRWCRAVDVHVVAHIYERRAEDGVFVYRESRDATDDHPATSHYVQ
jgi:hypothetical protein